LIKKVDELVHSQNNECLTVERASISIPDRKTPNNKVKNFDLKTVSNLPVSPMAGWK
jgi:hypothetical protein